SVALIRVADINKVTGYIRGGCSPIGMKRDYCTVLDVSALQHDAIVVSPGKIGQQIELAPRDLLTVTRATTAALVGTGVAAAATEP
ncbi:MAG TPA: YbaK/EbsC family protein, partial [bacterium]|nr:YbaK/EbsC family protein [bacterium]